MWSYEQTTGRLASPAGTFVGLGYSGHGAGLDNPKLQAEPMVGPIPQGNWQIGEFFDDSGGKGPIVAHLTPATGTETFGRSGFMIHGDNAELDHTASEGCLVLPHCLRQMIMSSQDRVLRVTE
jgi:hypothetical protein